MSVLIYTEKKNHCLNLIACDLIVCTTITSPADIPAAAAPTYISRLLILPLTAYVLSVSAFKGGWEELM